MYTKTSDESSSKSIKSGFFSTPSELTQLWVLIGRCNVQLYRDWTVTHLKLLLHILCAIVIGLYFGDSGINASKSISNIGFLLVNIVYIWYTTMMPGVLRFPAEISILKKETFNNWYKLRTYYLANLITSTPVHVSFFFSKSKLKFSNVLSILDAFCVSLRLYSIFYHGATSWARAFPKIRLNIRSARLCGWWLWNVFRNDCESNCKYQFQSNIHQRNTII